MNKDVVSEFRGIMDIVMELKESRDFFETESFNQIFNRIKLEEVVCQENLKYNETGGVKYKDFTKFCNSLFENVDPKLETSGAFPTYSVDYKGVVFELMMGQGSNYCAHLKK